MKIRLIRSGALQTGIETGAPSSNQDAQRFGNSIKLFL